jgi:hypothetical protein
MRPRPGRAASWRSPPKRSYALTGNAFGWRTQQAVVARVFCFTLPISDRMEEKNEWLRF